MTVLVMMMRVRMLRQLVQWLDELGRLELRLYPPRVHPLHGLGSDHQPHLPRSGTYCIVYGHAGFGYTILLFVEHALLTDSFLTAGELQLHSRACTRVDLAVESEAANSLITQGALVRLQRRIMCGCCCAHPLQMLYPCMIPR